MSPYRTQGSRPDYSTKPQRISTLLLAVACMVGGAIGETACTPGEKAAINTAIDIAGYACIIANADLPDEGAIATACGIAQVLGPDIKKIVTDFKGKRAAYAKAQMAAEHCAK